MPGRKRNPLIHPVTGALVPGELTGVIVPMFTPVNAEGEIDVKALRAYTEYLVDSAAVSTLFIRAGVGGLFTYRPEEFELVLEVIGEVAGEAGKPFLIGCPGTWPGWPDQPVSADSFIAESILFGNRALSGGAYAAVYPLPYGLLDPERDGADTHEVYLQYFEEVAGQVPGRMVLYHLPYLKQNQWIRPETLAQLLERHENIVGMKVSHGDVVHHSELLMVVDGSNFAYVCGNEQIYLPLLLMGACGLIGEGCNSMPEVFAAILRKFMAREYGEAREAQFVGIEALRLGQAVCNGHIFETDDEGVPSAGAFEVFAPDAIGLGYLGQKGVYPFGPALRSGGRWPSKEALPRLAREFDQLRAPYR